MANRRRTVGIIGLGTFGSVLARELTRMGDRVLGLDSDEKRVSDLSDEIDTTMQVDASDIKALKQCGLETCDSVVVSIGDNMQASILAAMNVMELECRGIWVKSQSDAHEKILKAIGIENTVRPEQDYGLRIAQVLHNPRVSDYLALGEGKYVADIEIPEKLVGTTVARLPFDANKLNCLGISRSGQVIRYDGQDIELKAGDSLLIFGERSDLRHFADEV